MKTWTRGFTLIEVLIVVLIVAILSAIAVPKYQRVLEKNQAALAITLLQEVYRAEQFYYLNHGTYTKDWDALDIHIPGVASTKKWWEHGESARSVLNGEWVLEWMSWKGDRIVLGRIKGPHAGGAFVIQLEPQKDVPLSVGQIYCAQKLGWGTTYKNSGYCDKIFKGTYVWHDGGGKYWSL